MHKKKGKRSRAINQKFKRCGREQALGGTGAEYPRVGGTFHTSAHSFVAIHILAREGSRRTDWIRKGPADLSCNRVAYTWKHVMIRRWTSIDYFYVSERGSGSLLSRLGCEGLAVAHQNVNERKGASGASSICRDISDRDVPNSRELPYEGSKMR